MFPFDYLGLTDAERHHYVLGVVDASLTASIGSARHRELSECITSRGLAALLAVIERDLIPQDNFGGVPMTFVVGQGLEQLCRATKVPHGG